MITSDNHSYGFFGTFNDNSAILKNITATYFDRAVRAVMKDYKVDQGMAVRILDSAYGRHMANAVEEAETEVEFDTALSKTLLVHKRYLKDMKRGLSEDANADTVVESLLKG